MASTARLGLKLTVLFSHVRPLIVGMASTARLGLKHYSMVGHQVELNLSEWPLQPVWD